MESTLQIYHICTRAQWPDGGVRALLLQVLGHISIWGSNHMKSMESQAAYPHKGPSILANGGAPWPDPY